uniref:Pirin N-terminal domain-containing protein n=1 Tax=Attheya septentrionalis TaxID=420275 RepID=A0A7S2UL16_9STRA|mmetsp:Transcript_27053/g.49229  ORF Transcript_27053/g.49229 Transcript_27053/m.49229 type:complete len:376 (+) Transcript_27053:193-1320(+)
MRSPILTQTALPTSGPYPTQDPFLFCVYHKDQYPPAINDKMEAPRQGNGQDFNPDAPYRMYHGDRIPGFPQHPHRGFETITATIDGIIDHADSVGNAGRYGMGDLQWMTAGSGVVHSETFPLIHQHKDNPTSFFQIWLNLPARSKMTDPSFAMFWAPDVPKYTSPDGKASVTLFAGNNYFGIQADQRNHEPPPDSWASDPANDVAIFHITLQPGGTLVLPKSNEDNVNRSLFLIEGAKQNKVVIQYKDDDKGSSSTSSSSPQTTVVNQPVILGLDSSQDVILELPESSETNSEFLMLQGKPINEPVARYGPFVMNTQAEIRQAFQDYGKTKFGGWPWPRDDMVFSRDKERFAHLKGVETGPPEDKDTCTEEEGNK